MGTLRVAVLTAVLTTTLTIAFSAAAASRGERDMKSLSPSLLKRIATVARKDALSLEDPGVKTAQVFGPDSRAALVKASSGDIVVESAREQKMRFYLIVLRGHFVCRNCSVPPGGKPPHGTIATLVWSPREGGTDMGISHRLAAGMARLGKPLTISLTEAATSNTGETPSALAMWTPTSGLLGMTSYHPARGSMERPPHRALRRP